MPISPAIRNQVRLRAHECCEYCHLHRRFSSNTHEIDHVIPVKLGGKDELENLAWACLDCNRHKGPKHEWDAHFEINEGEIRPKTIIGRVTILVLKLNEPELVEFRKTLWNAGLYP